MLGVAGAVREPLMGLHLGGFSGMATGLFTGWVGLLLRPTYGALMSTSQVRGRVRVFLPLCVCVFVCSLFFCSTRLADRREQVQSLRANSGQ